MRKLKLCFDNDFLFILKFNVRIIARFPIIFFPPSIEKGNCGSVFKYILGFLLVFIFILYYRLLYFK